MYRLPVETPFPAENIYGHLARVRWFTHYLTPRDRVVEIGCGTGHRITYPLRTWGYNAIGLDLDQPSIDYGREVFRRGGEDPEALMNQRLEDLPGRVTAIIASEVLEHVPDPDLEQMLQTFWHRLTPGGLLLVTVPNGYGWFEFEVLMWSKLRLGLVLRYSGLAFLISRLKDLVAPGRGWDRVRSTVADSPHVHRFTLSAIRSRLESAGFVVEEARGSVAVAGPFSDLLFTGVPKLEQLNEKAGRRLGRFAASFWLAARKPHSPQTSSALDPNSARSDEL